MLLLTTLAAAATSGFGGPAGIWGAILQDFSNITDPAAFSAFLQVLMIDLVLAGDNAIVVGALAAGLRRKASADVRHATSPHTMSGQRIHELT